MEMGSQEREKKKRKKKSSSNLLLRPSSMSSLQQQKTIFPILLAALSKVDNLPNPQPVSESVSIVIGECLSQLLRSLLPKTSCALNDPLILSAPILSLLPLLLNSDCADIAAQSLEIVGVASLFSYEMNERIAMDDEILEGLISAVESSTKRVSMAACNAILDLSTTSAGCQRLLEFSAVQKLVYHFIQAPKCEEALVLVSVCVNREGNGIPLGIGFREDEFLVLLLHATISLINSCTMKQLENIPEKLSQTFQVYLKKLWAEIRKQVLHGTVMKLNQDKQFCVSNITANNLVESIFRLSLDADPSSGYSNVKNVERNFFGCDKTSFEQFLSNYWEICPLVMRRHPNSLADKDDIFHSFLEFLGPKDAAPLFLSEMLKNLVSCPPISSDELDLLSFLKEVRNQLGCPVIYQQDIRILKTQLARERHFFQGDSEHPYILFINDILRCEAAYEEGYTIALRGMEFRFESIAVITNQLASLFGQPSAGANIYLTPPNSQGLACHCDDHCVFVCQLIGFKQWTIFPLSNLCLPRLYESVDSKFDSKFGDPIAVEPKKYLLREGDVLYIPRGCAHEASTVIDIGRSNETAGFSLHLTLAIEVEPPFEWEGFMHVALALWHQNQDPSQHTSTSWDLQVVAVKLIHVAMELIGDIDSSFRKACLVGAMSSSSDIQGWFHTNQRIIFKDLMHRINTESKFLDVIDSIEVAVKRNQDPLQRLGWLRHLNNEGAIIGGHNWDDTLMGTSNFSLLNNPAKDEAGATFMLIKSKFCTEVVFEDVEQKYKILLQKYKKSRKQYMNGMLSLHCH